MRKLISNILIAVASVLVLFATGCQEPVEVVVSPYLDVVPEEYNATALGEGDAFLLSIRSTVAWELSAVDNSGAPVDWIRFDVTSGTGDADVLGFILRGDRETDRTCTIVLTTSEAKLEKRLEMKQGIFVPVILQLDFARPVPLLQRVSRRLLLTSVSSRLRLQQFLARTFLMDIYISQTADVIS